MPAKRRAYAITKTPSMADNCPVCYAEVADTMVCGNEHSLCQGCYLGMLNSARAANQNCAVCRDPMFHWGDGTQDPVLADRRNDDPRSLDEQCHDRVVALINEGKTRRQLTDIITAEYPALFVGPRGGRASWSYRQRADSDPPLPPRVRVIHCSRCGEEGHIRTNRSCPMHPRRAGPQLADQPPLVN